MYKLAITILVLSSGVLSFVKSEEDAASISSPRLNDSSILVPDDGESDSSQLLMRLSPGVCNNRCCQNLPIRDDYTVTPNVGAHKLIRRLMPWNAARNYCLKEGGHLVIVNSVAEEAILLNIMRYENLWDLWTGVHNRFDDRDWVTLAGESVESAGYAHWRSGEPNNAGGNEHCATMRRNVRDDFGMDDRDCGIWYQFVCEIEVCGY
ncbi:hemolymph lipopolysaccharide-binding protein-like [Colletes latitarsis]|uniref:hemolymph lipopolysaccharide-binding protein-like n=1 Tax=Colletes latitarsis TaxID=2605962 RepID=UPI004036C13F